MYYVDAQGEDCQHLVFGIMQWKPSFICCKQGCHADSINHLTTGTKAGYGGQLRRLSSSLLAELDERGVFPLAYHDGRIPSGAMRFRRACCGWWRLNRRWACPLSPYTYLDVSWGAVTDIKTQLVDDSVNTAWARRFANEGPEQGSSSTSWYVRIVAAREPVCQSKGRFKCRWVLTVGCNCHSACLVPTPGSHLALLWCFTLLWLPLMSTHTNTQGKLRYELHFNTLGQCILPCPEACS